MSSSKAISVTFFSLALNSLCEALRKFFPALCTEEISRPMDFLARVSSSSPESLSQALPSGLDLAFGVIVCSDKAELLWSEFAILSGRVGQCLGRRN